MREDVARRQNYGVFSCRFGNIYTVRQLLQLFDRAYGKFIPNVRVWRRADGRFLDPFRPQIEPDGLDSEASVIDSQERHLEFARQMFERLDIMVFTLGLTEGWQARSDGAVYPMCPAVVDVPYDSAKCEFVNFNIHETECDLRRFIERLRSVNPKFRVLLTVSPVPLIATYEPRHVLVSTTYSKSVLRVAAQTVCDSILGVDYFPSYEIIAGNFTMGRYATTRLT